MTRWQLTLAALVAVNATAVAQETADALVDQADPSTTLKASTQPEVGDLLTKSETLFYDWENGRIGIGVEPDTKLMVHDTIRLWTNRNLTENIAQGGLQMCNINYTRGWSANPVGFQSYGGPLELNPLGLNGLRLVDSVVVATDGRVGIGKEPGLGMNLDVAGILRASDTIISTKPGGAPFQIASTDVSANLNADLLDGFHAEEFSRFGEEVDHHELANGSVGSDQLQEGLRASKLDGHFPQHVTLKGGATLHAPLVFPDGSEMTTAAAGGGGGASGGDASFSTVQVDGPNGEVPLYVTGDNVGNLDSDSLDPTLVVEDDRATTLLLGESGSESGAELVLARAANLHGFNPILIRDSWSLRHAGLDAGAPLTFYHSSGLGASWEPVVTLSPEGRMGIGTASPDHALDVAGTTRTQALAIAGGADVAEGFDVNSPAGAPEPAPGMVVVVDADRPGGLKVSSQAYDRCVAGILSGANGLAPGLVLGKEGDPFADGEHHVALTGRVWCKAVGGEFGISPGDLLTTSAKPGHAMAVQDYARSQGAVLGKAMTAISKGEQGLVLVLVSLQ